MKKMAPSLRRIYHKLSVPSPPNMLGDRDIEHSWIAANIPEGDGKALDFGSGSTWMGFLAARRGYEVLSIDLTPHLSFYSHPELEFQQVDLFDLNVQEKSLDLIINCSTIEHVGLKGRYNVTEEKQEGDFEAIKYLKQLLKPGKRMLLTIPVGKDVVYHPYHRVYGLQRLPKLLNGWKIVKEEYWLKDDQNQWCQTEKETALSLETKQHYYGLGLFVLQ